MVSAENCGGVISKAEKERSSFSRKAAPAWRSR